MIDGHPLEDDDMATYGHEGGGAFNEDQRGGHTPSPPTKTDSYAARYRKAADLMGRAERLIADARDALTDGDDQLEWCAAAGDAADEVRRVKDGLARSAARK